MDSLKTNYLFIWHYMTVTKVCHEHSLNFKNDKSPSELKKNNKKNMKWFFKNQLPINNRFFSQSKRPYETKTNPFMAFCLSESPDCSICSRKCNFKLIYFIEKTLI